MIRIKTPVEVTPVSKNIVDAEAMCGAVGAAEIALAATYSTPDAQIDIPVSDWFLWRGEYRRVYLRHLTTGRIRGGVLPNTDHLDKAQGFVVHS